MKALSQTYTGWCLWAVSLVSSQRSKARQSNGGRPPLAEGTPPETELPPRGPLVCPTVRLCYMSKSLLAWVGTLAAFLASTRAKIRIPTKSGRRGLAELRRGAKRPTFARQTALCVSLSLCGCLLSLDTIGSNAGRDKPCSMPKE
jgi:hypothetical protein